MGNLFEDFKTEDDFEVEGIWKEYKGHTKVKIARAGNKNVAYFKYFKKSAKKYENAGTDTKEDIDRPWAEVFAKTIIKGWQSKDGDKWVDGIAMPDKKGVVEIKPFNYENVMKVLLMLPDFFSILREDADKLTTFQKEQEVEDAKN
jgi:hypothetical protein